LHLRMLFAKEINKELQVFKPCRFMTLENVLK
jgi:hypothetical protein